jgi:hypothetical protein
MIAGLIIGAAIMFFVLMGLYVVRHVRVMHAAQVAHSERMRRFEKAMEAVTRQQTSLRQDQYGIEAQVSVLRAHLRNVEEARDRGSFGGPFASAFDGETEAEEKASPPISSWTELLAVEEP